jgi:hypothetical protein
MICVVVSLVEFNVVIFFMVADVVLVSAECSLIIYWIIFGVIIILIITIILVTVLIHIIIVILTFIIFPIFRILIFKFILVIN